MEVHCRFSSVHHAKDVHWKYFALINQFWKGLWNELRAELPESLGEQFQCCVAIDSKLEEYDMVSQPSLTPNPSFQIAYLDTNSVELMQIGAMKKCLSAEDNYYI